MHAREPSQINMIEQYRPPCPNCGGLTLLVRIEPAEDPDHNLRTFECACGRAEIANIKFR